MKKTILFLMVFMPTLAFADYSEEVQKVEESTQACLDNPENYSTQGMIYCTVEGFNSADAILNKLYQEIVTELKTPTNDEYMDKYNNEALARLIAAQRAWITYRNANSDLHGVEMLGGTGENLVITGVSYSMTKDRVNELQNLLLLGR